MITLKYILSAHDNSTYSWNVARWTTLALTLAYAVIQLPTVEASSSWKSADVYLHKNQLELPLTSLLLRLPEGRNTSSGNHVPSTVKSFLRCLGIVLIEIFYNYTIENLYTTKEKELDDQVPGAGYDMTLERLGRELEVSTLYSNVVASGLRWEGANEPLSLISEEVYAQIVLPLEIFVCAKTNEDLDDLFGSSTTIQA